MKRRIAILSLLILVVVSIVRMCRGGDDTASVAQAQNKPVVPIDTAMRTRVDSFVKAQQHVGSLGLVVYDLTADTTVFDLAGEASMRPASCMKLLTCVTAMSRLGMDYEFRTRLFTEGTVVKDTLRGNLVIKSHFDPAFNRDSLVLLLAGVKAAGIKAVTGRVVLDMAFLEPMDHEQHWTLGDLKVARLGLLHRGFARYKREVMWALPGAAGVSVKADSIVFGRLNTRRAKELGEVKTPLSYAVGKALKNSSNINAESLLYPLGYTVSRRGRYREDGVVALREFVSRNLGMDAEKHVMLEDGCGLCPEARMTPQLLVRILKYVAERPKMHAMVMEGLPLSGTDGTLHDRLRKPHVVGKVRAKTGTLTREDGISTLAGYYKSESDGHDMVFAIMNNECPVMDGRWWQDRFIERALLPKKK